MKKILLLSLCLVLSCILGGGKLSAQNVSFEESNDGKTLTITVNGTATDNDANIVASQMNSKSYTEVIVKGGVITPTLIKKALFTCTSIKNLDLSGASYNSTTLEADCFNNGKGSSNHDWTWNNLSDVHISLPSNITVIGEQAFYNCGTLTEVVLPEGLTAIGKYAFLSAGLDTLSLPEKLDKIELGAFYNVKSLAYVHLNSNLRFIGAGAFGLDGNGVDLSQRTLTVPQSVRYIGPYAFSERKYSDIYFEGKVTPVCPFGSFVDSPDSWANTKYGTAFTGTDDKVHYCNGGHNPKSTTSIGEDDPATSGYANRDNYINGGYYMTIIHYPSDAEDANRYTDQTRKYVTGTSSTFKANESFTVGSESECLSYYYDHGKGSVQIACTYMTGTVLAGYKDTYKGSAYIWPSQSQYIRAYVNAGLGLNWDGVTKYEPELAEWAINILKEAGFDTDDADMKKNAYLGTRKFALTKADIKSGEDYEFNDLVKDGEWWTLCVPFNMTKKQVKETFGEDTEVCLFNKVDRDFAQKDDMSHYIKLYFTCDVMKRKVGEKNADGTWNTSEYQNITEAPEDDDVVIYAHESYMILPMKGKNSDQDPVYVVKNYEPVEGNPLPTLVTSGLSNSAKAWNRDHEEDQDMQFADNQVEYRFIGNYIESKIPAYSYVYGKKNNKTQFWFVANGNATWKPNKSVVQTTDREQGAVDNQDLFGAKNEAKQLSAFGSLDDDDNSTTNIEYHIIAGENADAPIYSIDGKMVSRDGDAYGLAKGVYVQNGKKFVVK